MIVEIKKSRAKGCVYAPPSKSVAHRLLIAAALADGTSKIQGISECDDVLATIDCLSALGASIEHKEKDILYSVVGRDEVDKVISAIQAIDEHAFINVINTERINGRFYKPPTR